MALLRCEFKSVLLGKAVSANIIIPQCQYIKGGNHDRSSEPGYKTLFLLHGLSDDCSAWCRYSSIERYATKYNIAVVMPDGGRSFYTDAKNGFPWWTFISEELPQSVSAMFNLSLKREDCFAAGLSMGGYGALKLGLRCPERFAAVAGLSPVVDLHRRFTAPESSPWLPELVNIFGSPEAAVADGNDLLTLAKEAKASGTRLPRILTICGSDDFMIQDNREFNQAMDALQLDDYRHFEYPGNHNWEFWDTHIQQALKFFFEAE